MPDPLAAWMTGYGIRLEVVATLGVLVAAAIGILSLNRLLRRLLLL